MIRIISILLSLSFVLLTTLRAQDTTSVYVSAHPDDWQLFMNPNAYNDLKNPNHKIIFLHTTAGDNGAGIGNNNYYLAREEGSLRAIRFMSNTFTSGAGLGINMNETTQVINGHPIKKFTYRNAVAYFLRLPDGHPQESLEKIYQGIVSSIGAVDNSTTYTSLGDLKNTMKAIVEAEASNLNKLVFHVADDDHTHNPGDHSDHIFSSKIMQDVAAEINNVTLKLYTEYHTSTLNQNIFEDDFMINAGTWGSTASGLSDLQHSSTWDQVHNAWVAKQYFRTKKVTSPASIAYNKPAYSSSNEPGHIAANAVDNNFSLSNYWSASPHGQWWMVDLQNTYDVNTIKVFNYYDGTRYYQYDVEASLDSITWTKIVDHSTNTTAATATGDSFAVSTTARYLRVNMTHNSANPGVHIIEFEAYGNLALLNTTNVALNKTTNSSSNEPGHIAANAVDNNFALTNYWAASPHGQWWMVDLAGNYDLNKIKVFNYYDGTRYYRYDVEASLDNVTWTKIADHSTNTNVATAAGDSFAVSTTARYLRVNMLFNSANPGVHIIEFEAYGVLAASPSISAPGVSAKTVVDNDQFILSPNPSSSMFNVDLSKNLGEAVKYFIVDFSGNIVRYGEFNAEHNTVESIDMSNQRGGTYFIQFECENGETTSKTMLLSK